MFLIENHEYFRALTASNVVLYVGGDTLIHPDDLHAGVDSLRTGESLRVPNVAWRIRPGVRNVNGSKPIVVKRVCPTCYHASADPEREPEGECLCGEDR